jgi:hypothetical protein
MTDHSDLVPVHNDQQVPAQEKLEWVTPKISLIEAGDTHGKRDTATRPNNYRVWVLPDQLYLKPRHTYKNQSSQRVYQDPFLVCGGHLRH